MFQLMSVLCIAWCGHSNRPIGTPLKQVVFFLIQIAESADL
jgi:hypothetical protein